jgi:hypothetical protein
MTPLEKAWAAGILEGEGTIRINKARMRNLGHLQVSVVNTDIEIVKFFQDRWPGSLKGLHPLGNRRAAFLWTVVSRKAESFLIEIEPYVLTNRVKEKIKIGLRFQSQKNKHGGIVTDQYREQQWLFFMAMKELNLRGVHDRDPGYVLCV